MIEEVKQDYVFVVHMREPDGQVIMIPASKDLTFEKLVKKIDQNPRVMTLKGKDGLNVIIVRPADTISFVVEDKIESVRENLKKMNEAQHGGGQIVKPNFMFPGGKRGR